METWFWVLGWFLSILTMAENGFVIFLVCRKRQLRTKTNAFVVSLAVADLFVGILAVPSRFFCEMTSECSFLGPLREGLFVVFVRVFVVYASGTNLCSLVLERYMAVVKPLKYLTFMKRRRVIQMVSISWGTPFTFTGIVSSLRINDKKIALGLVDLVNGWLYMFFEVILSIVVIFCLAHMLLVVYKQKRKDRIVAKQLQFNQRVTVKTQGKSAVKMMAIVTGVFLVCYGIFMRCNFVLMFSNHHCNDFQYKVPLQVINSAINPVAYAVFKRDIKKECKRLLFKMCR